MNGWKNYLVPALFALGGLGWLVRVVKHAVKGDPLDVTGLCFGSMFVIFAVVVHARIQKARGGPGVTKA